MNCRSLARLSLQFLALLLSGCAKAPTSSDASIVDAGRDAAPIVCTNTADTDGDGIADATEGVEDRDADGMPNSSDLDSDGDGVADAIEARSPHVCAPANSDGDSTYDFLDFDSDNDGLSDEREADLGTDPTRTDSDGDGVTDFGEVDGTHTDPRDAESTIAEGDFFLVLPHDASPQQRTLRFKTTHDHADVFFLVDTTESMREERASLIAGLNSEIIPGIARVVSDARFGIGGVDDYPYPETEGGYGSRPDLPFYLLREIGAVDEDALTYSLAASEATCPGGATGIGGWSPASNGIADLTEAVRGLPCHGGGDGPEAYGPALFALATGMGLTWPTGEIPGRTCTSGHGYACFREGAQPIIVLVGDNLFHNGPSDSPTFRYAIPAAPRYPAVLEALRSIGARVVGIHSGRDASDFERIARDTGAVNADGEPLVFRLSGNAEGLAARIVDGVVGLAGGAPQDVTTRTRSLETDVDAAAFVASVVPREGYVDGAAGRGYERRDEATFYSTQPGTMVEFEVSFVNRHVLPQTVGRIYRAQIRVIGGGVSELDTRRVYVVVPPANEIILI